jgi:glycine cleavage system aminomethyltransferase T
MALDPFKYRADWELALDASKPYYTDRPPMFSSAAAAQDEANRSRMLWQWAPIWLPWEYTNWMDEARSFHDSAYIGDWSGLVKIKISGPDALAFLTHIGTNDLSNFAIGRVKHFVQVNEHGKLASQGVLYRIREDEFLYTGGSAYWTVFALESGDWDAESAVVSSESFLFAVQGPRSRVIMESATGVDLGSIRFGDWAEHSIAGTSVRVLRTGVSGELGYELHGPVEAGEAVWRTIVEHGSPLGIRQLGVRSQLISHVESGIATNDRDFVSAAVSTPGAPQINPSARARISGSFRPDDMTELQRSPAELGWYRQVSLETHDFVGRDALIAERDSGGPARRLTGLVWNPEDVVAVYATLFEEDSAQAMELPRLLNLAVDRATHHGKDVGVSTSRVYSPFLHRMISLGHLDVDLTTAGREVEVVWGEPAQRQLAIRAHVVDLPFKPDNRRVQ